MAKSILTPRQKIFLDLVASDKYLTKNFYLTGGTALSEFYLQHRLSEDLDFFSENEIDKLSILTFIKSVKNKLQYKKFDFQESFNRNIYHLIFDDKDSLKVEFTYYPFTQIDKPISFGNLRIDNLKDIAVNKLFTIVFNPRRRDFYDLYKIIKKTRWKMDALIKLVRSKFDTHIDYLQLGANLSGVSKFKDDPILPKDKKERETVEKFFLNEALELKNKIIIKE